MKHHLLTHDWATKQFANWHDGRSLARKIKVLNCCAEMPTFVISLEEQGVQGEAL